MELQTALETCYSCRAYLEQAPTKEQIDAILEAGRIAPTARNDQAQHLWVVTKPEDLEKIDLCTHCRYNAPVVFILGYDKNVQCTNIWNEPDVWSFGELDITSVLMQMLLKATDLGLATCWLGAFNEAAVRQQFDIPENFAIRALIDLGIPDPEKGGPSPRHTDRKPLTETVTWL